MDELPGNFTRLPTDDDGDDDSAVGQWECRSRVYKLHAEVEIINLIVQRSAVIVGYGSTWMIKRSGRDGRVLKTNKPIKGIRRRSLPIGI